MKIYLGCIICVVWTYCGLGAQEPDQRIDLKTKPGVTATGEKTLYCGELIPQSKPFPPPAAFGFFSMAGFPTGAWELNGDVGLALYAKKTGYLKKSELSYDRKYLLGGYRGWVYQEKGLKRRWFFSACPHDPSRPYYAEQFVNDSSDECGWEYVGTVRGIPIPLE